MSTSTSVNKSLNAGALGSTGRPLSLISTLGVLGVSLYISHKGLVHLFGQAGDLILALTCLLFFVAILQWAAMGRAAACHRAQDYARRNMQFAQAALLGLVEVVMNWNGVIQMAAEGGMDWGGVSLAGALVAIFATGGALLNVTAKWTSCEPLDPKPGDICPSPAAAPLDGADIGPRLAWDSQIETAGGRQLLNQMHRDAEALRQKTSAARDPSTGQFIPKRKRKAA